MTHAKPRQRRNGAGEGVCVDDVRYRHNGETESGPSVSTRVGEGGSGWGGLHVTTTGQSTRRVAVVSSLSHPLLDRRRTREACRCRGAGGTRDEGGGEGGRRGEGME